MPPSPLGSRLRALIVGTAVAASGFMAAAPAAHASPAAGTTTESATSTTSSTSTLTARQRWNLKADKVLNAASSRRGDPYVYGAAGPRRFDCSGLVLWAYARALGKSLPHSAELQMKRSTHISRSRLRPGDLIFEVDSSGYAYHVGIFAGHHKWWVAPHTGSHVQKQTLYPSRKRYGRLIKTS